MTVSLIEITRGNTRMDTPSDTPLLQTRGLGRQPADDGRWLLRDIDFQIHAGERLAIVGPTGAGKTVLLRALAALDPIEAGEILWRGESITDAAIPEFRRQAIYLHQRPALFEGSVETNLRLPYSLEIHEREQFDKSRVMELLRQVGREPEFLQQQAGDLSGGESQIVAAVRALQLNPSLLLLDEPTAALDAKTTSELEQLILRWQKEAAARAVIWVSHDPAQVQRVAQREFGLKDGKHLRDSVVK